MSDSNQQTPGKKLFFVTLKVSKELKSSEILVELYDKREYSDEFIRTLIYFIEKKQMEVFGFVILSDQIHLILRAEHGEILESIDTLKAKCAKEAFRIMVKNLNSMDKANTRKQKALRKVFNSFLNSDESIFWQKKNRPIELRLKHNNILPITSEMLKAHLIESERNNLEIGANTFTKLMLDTMKI